MSTELPFDPTRAPKESLRPKRLRRGYAAVFENEILLLSIEAQRKIEA